MSMGDLSKKYKIGQLIMEKYRWPGEPKMDYVFKIDGFRYGGSIMDVVLVKVRKDGKWLKDLSRFNRSQSMWDYKFEIGDKTPTQGTGRAFLYKGSE
jgi:hypothetical protein